MSRKSHLRDLHLILNANEEATLSCSGQTAVNETRNRRSEFCVRQSAGHSSADLRTIEMVWRFACTVYGPRQFCYLFTTQSATSSSSQFIRSSNTELSWPRASAVRSVDASPLYAVVSVPSNITITIGAWKTNLNTKIFILCWILCDIIGSYWRKYGSRHHVLACVWHTHTDTIHRHTHRYTTQKQPHTSTKACSSSPLVRTFAVYRFHRIESSKVIAGVRVICENQTPFAACVYWIFCIHRVAIALNEKILN